MRNILFISLLIFIIGCAGLKSSWTNFRAHYNTYYNAEKSFRAGLKKVEDQPVEINPELPIRVHVKPSPVSEEDFDNTIEKGAQILRKFPESKWTDDALALIGKSYYYKGDYFLAIEKFEELAELTEKPRFKQQAAIWKARSLLDLEQYAEGTSYTSNNLNAEFWTPSSKAEFRVLLAEHLAMQENWSEAANHLGEAVANVEESVLKARVFFLYGQVLERLERYGEAFFAYDNVASHFPDYEYVFWSKLKKAEVARKESNLEPALSIFTSMSKDDKNFSRLDRINYEVARTREMQGDIQEAEKEYKEILHSDNTSTSRNVQAKTYYRLGKIYSDQYSDFNTAAAYFDSSSSQVTNIEYLESNFNAEQLASIYGTYANLQSQISHLDSLLWLGSLKPAQLDSVLEVVREQKRESMNKQLATQEDAGNRLVNINVGDQPEEESTTSSEYGFLNYRNPRLKRESIEEFNAVWGNRPLVDNWRRIEVVRSTGISSAETGDASTRNSAEPVYDANDAALDIDVSEIPTSQEEREEYVKKLVGAKYELGNLFFLTLNLPDSAETYFTEIVRRYPNNSLVPQSMYSLFDIHSVTGNEQKAEYWGNKILQEFPDSRYAKKVSARMNGEEQETVTVDSSSVLLSQIQNIETLTDSLSPVQAEQFRRLAIANRSVDIAPFIYFRAIKEYVELAKSNTSPLLYNQFMQAQASEDTTAQTLDSTNYPSYPFFGMYWDSVRTVIAEYDTMFTEPSHKKELDILKEALDTSNVAKPSISVVLKPSPDNIKACGDLNANIDIVGGMANFISSVNYPQNVQKGKLPEKLTYEILISEKGKVSSYRLVSKKTLPEAEQAFGTAIKNSLLFDPFSVDGETKEVRCRITFPVKTPPKPVSSRIQIRPCEDHSANIEMVGGMKNFLSRVEYPEKLKDMSLSGEVSYEILISKKGKASPRRLISKETLPAVDEAFETAIQKYLIFDPVIIDGAAREVRCKITFPVKN